IAGPDEISHTTQAQHRSRLTPCELELFLRRRGPDGTLRFDADGLGGIEGSHFDRIVVACRIEHLLVGAPVDQETGRGENRGGQLIHTGDVVHLDLRLDHEVSLDGLVKEHPGIKVPPGLSPADVERQTARAGVLQPVEDGGRLVLAPTQARVTQVREVVVAGVGDGHGPTAAARPRAAARPTRAAAAVSPRATARPCRARHASGGSAASRHPAARHRTARAAARYRAAARSRAAGAAARYRAAPAAARATTTAAASSRRATAPAGAPRSAGSSTCAGARVASRARRAPA